MVSPVSVKNNCGTIVFVSVIFSIFACHLISISFMEQAYTKIKQSLTTPFVYLKTFKDRVFFAVGMFVYLNLFLILFNPFNIYNWLGIVADRFRIGLCYLDRGFPISSIQVLQKP